MRPVALREPGVARLSFPVLVGSFVCGPPSRVEVVGEKPRLLLSFPPLLLFGVCLPRSAFLAGVPLHLLRFVVLSFPRTSHSTLVALPPPFDPPRCSQPRVR